MPEPILCPLRTSLYQPGCSTLLDRIDLGMSGGCNTVAVNAPGQKTGSRRERLCFRSAPLDSPTRVIRCVDHSELRGPAISITAYIAADHCRAATASSS